MHRRVFVLAFAIVGYLVAIGLYFAPHTWHLSPRMVIAICPPSVLAMMSMSDPSFGAMAGLIGPLNAAVCSSQPRPTNLKFAPYCTYATFTQSIATTF
jgi:hypothetical protein